MTIIKKHINPLSITNDFSGLIMGMRDRMPGRVLLSKTIVFLILCIGCALNYPPFANSRSLARISLAGSNESWTDYWIIESSAMESPEKLKAGFYNQIPLKANLRLPTGRRGFVCIFPESRHTPAIMVRRNVNITNENKIITAKVTASSRPRGKWEFALKVNDKLHKNSVIISGNDGWQDMEFDLTGYIGRSVDIRIEGKMVSSGRHSAVFIDYIGFSGDKKNRSDSVPLDYGNDKLNGNFDAEYMMFLEMLRKHEEIRQFRLMDQRRLDYYYQKSDKKKHLKK